MVLAVMVYDKWLEYSPSAHPALIMHLSASGWCDSNNPHNLPLPVSTVDNVDTSKANRSDSTRHGAQGEYNTPSDGALENEFGTKVVEDVIKVILAKGEIQENEVSAASPSPLLTCVC